jgi:diguanylate cyclase (GGDEF)-like protein
MNKSKISVYMLETSWRGWRRWTAWAISIGALFLLGILRTVTDADFTFTSLAILPVLAISWIGGKNNGLVIAALAAAMWSAADIVSERQFSAQWIPWANAATRLMTYSLVALLTSQIRLQFKREYVHATRDSLTGVLNRRAFFEAGATEVAHPKHDTHSLAVIFLDLDDFKQLNDSKGHDAGDAALRATAKAMLGAVSSCNCVARLGGDEFAVIIPEVEYEAAVEAGRQIYTAVNTSLANFPPVTGSIGVAWFEKIDRVFPAMVKAADELMYEVKESGKNNMRSQRIPNTVYNFSNENSLLRR